MQDLQDFLDLYYKACSVLLKEEDFYELMYSYLMRAAIDNVQVAEIFFDPQTHTERGVSFETVVDGLYRALIDGYQNLGLKGSLIMCFLRHLPLENHLATLEEAKPFLDKILGVGLDSGELGNPPGKFREVYQKAVALGLKPVAHSGEEGGPEYVYGALDELHVKRIDHGVRCIEDEQLVRRLVAEKIPLTVCPLSNSKLNVNARFFDGRNVTRKLLDMGLKVTINSDDPAYFGGYITDNFLATVAETGMTERDVHEICCNAFNATFLPRIEKEFYLQRVKRFNEWSGVVVPPKSITFFGSRAPQAGTPRYQSVYEAAALFASHGYRVVNGGYSGTMEAASKGASDVGGVALGVVAPRVFPKRTSQGNQYLSHHIYVRSINERIEHLTASSQYFVVFPGTLGTLTELLYVWNMASVRAQRGYSPARIFISRDLLEKVTKELISSTGIYEKEVVVEFFDKAEEVLQAVEEDWKERARQAHF